MKFRDQAHDRFTENLLPQLEVDRLRETAPQRGMQITHTDIGLIRNVFQPIAC